MNYYYNLTLFSILLLLKISIFSCSAVSKSNLNDTLIDAISSRISIVDAAGMLVQVSSQIDTQGSPLEFAGSFFNIISLIFGFGQSNPLAEINKKLDEILNHLESISKSIESVISSIGCVNLQNDLRNNIRNKLNGLISLLRVYYKNPSNQQYKNDIINKCRDQTQGVEKIYSDFKIFLEEDTANFMKSCGYYENDAVNSWAQSVLGIAKMFIFVLASCEQINEYKSSFVIYKFSYEIEKFVQYYTYKGFPEAFVKDPTHVGLKSVVEGYINKKKNAYEIESLLRQRFGYFNWHVIRYSVQMCANRGRYDAWYAYTPDEIPIKGTICSSALWEATFKNCLNYLVAWCISDDLGNNNLQIHGDGTTNPYGSVANTNNANLGVWLNYILSVNLFDGGWTESAGNDLKCSHMGVLYTCASKKRDLNLNKIVFTQGILWPDSNQMKITITSEYFTYNSTSLSGNYYGSWEVNDQSKCLQKCSDPGEAGRCHAVSATKKLLPGLNLFECRFFEKYSYSLTNGIVINGNSFIKYLRYQNLRLLQKTDQPKPNYSTCNLSANLCWNECLKDSNCVFLTCDRLPACYLIYDSEIYFLNKPKAFSISKLLI